MKKLTKVLLSLTLATTMMFSVAACAEGMNSNKTGGMGIGIGAGYSDCIVEAVVVVDGFGQPIKVEIDEIFSFKNVVNNVALSATADKVTIATKEYFKYLKIGDKYFESDGVTVNKYSQIGVDNGIADLEAFCKTDDGIKWFYDSFVAGKANVCKVDATGADVGDIKLKTDKAFSPKEGSMRKKRSTYWDNMHLGFEGNMAALENYLLAYGFDNLDTLTLPSGDDKYNTINGIVTGATLNKNTALYLNAAKKAYDIAISNQSDK